MKFLCGSCRTKYQISDDKVRGKILTIRCKKCGAKILVRESLAVGGGTAVAPVAEEEARVEPKPRSGRRAERAARASAPGRGASSAYAASPGGTGAPAARTGGSAALASAYELAMGQSASESDDMPTSIAPVPANLEFAGVEWYTAVDGSQQGPFAFAEVVQRVEDRQLIGRHYVWHDGMENWTRLRDVPDLAKYLPSPRSVPPPPPSAPETGPDAEVVELAARRQRLGADLLDSGATSVQSTPAERSDGEHERADELDRALNDVLGLDAAQNSGSTGGSATQDVEDDMMSSEDLFANIPRATAADDVHRESTRFFVAAAGVNKQRKRRRIGLISGIVASVALVAFLGGWAVGLFSIRLPGIGDPFANMRQGRALTEAGPPGKLSEKELSLLKGEEKRKRRARRKATAGRSRRGDGLRPAGPDGDYVDNDLDGASRGGPRGLSDEQKIAIGALETDGAAGSQKLPEVALPTTSPDMPVPDARSLTQAAVAKVVKQNSMSVRFCYQQSLKGSKSLRGKLEIKLRVEPTGRVSRTQVETSQFKGTTLARCISDKIRKWTFPRFEGEAKEFLVPFVLEKAF